MYFEKFRLFFLSRLKVAFPSTTIRLDIAFTKVSTVEIVSAKPNTITNKANNSVCSLNNKVKIQDQVEYLGLLKKQPYQ